MTDTYYFYMVCPVCDGDGIVTTTSPIPPYDVVSNPCSECLGPSAKYPKAGRLFRGWLEEVD